MRVDPQLFSLTVSTGSPSSPYFTTLVCGIYRTVTPGSFPRVYLSQTGSPSPYLIEPGQRGIFPVFTHSPLTGFSVFPVLRTLRGNRTLIFHSPLTDFPVFPVLRTLRGNLVFDLSLAVNWFARLPRTPIFPRKLGLCFFTRRSLISRSLPYSVVS